MISTPASCPLCTPSSERVLWSDDQFRVIGVTDPQLPGFIRLISQAHIAEVSDLSAQAQNRMFSLLVGIESAMRQILAPDKVNLASLGNQVPHLHWHIIPRWKDDLFFPDSIWSAPKQRQNSVSITALQAERAARADDLWKALPAVCTAVR
jgi:diadenosine tetraphosphate (Ap4A) HIT family hydrolase